MIVSIIGLIFSAFGVLFNVYRYVNDDNKESINTAIAFFGQVVLWLVIITIQK